MTAENGLTHLDDQGGATMVDVGGKAGSARIAVAGGWIQMSSDLLAQLENLPKGNAFEVAKLAGIMAAKKTADLIPLCHPLALNYIGVQFETVPAESKLKVTAEVRCHGRTGVEMEALAAVSVALLTLYDMGKAVDPRMTMGGICLLRKSGGKKGDWRRETS